MNALPVRENLLAIYRCLFGAYGPQHWWPAETPFEVIVGAILTQSTAWTNVEKAIANLKAAGVLNSPGLRELGSSELAQLVRPSGYFNVKARKLRAFVQRLAERWEDDLDRLFVLPVVDLREELLSIYGVGPETADSIILYAAGKPIFVVDAYTQRLFSRLGLVEPPLTYEKTQRLFMDHLPLEAALFNEYHALIVRHAKYVCRKNLRETNCLLDRICRKPADKAACAGR